MTPSRREFLALLAGGLASSFLPATPRAAAGSRIYLSARADAEERCFVTGLMPSGAIAFDLPLPARGHAFAVSPRGETAVHFARRPGRFAKVISLSEGRGAGGFAAPEDRHFYGHGVFAQDGRLLYATENDFEGARGVVGVYDARDGYRRVAELPSHGIEPHEIRLLPGGETLVVANGGILTHPDLPRVELNVPTMAPSLAYLDRRTGALLHALRLEPSLHQLSIRHIDVAANGTLAIGMQYRGPAGELVPLVATQRGTEPLRLLECPATVLRDMRQYCGSIAFDRDGEVIAASAPRGNLVTLWERRTGGLISAVTIADGCGLAPATRPGTFLASSGLGRIAAIDAATGATRAIAPRLPIGTRWDNHLAVADDRRVQLPLLGST